MRGDAPAAVCSDRSGSRPPGMIPSAGNRMTCGQGTSILALPISSLTPQSCLPDTMALFARTATALVVLLLLPTSARAQEAEDEELKASPVVVAEAVQRELAGGRMLVGTVVPARRSTVGSAVDGRVVEYAIAPGQAVRQGEPLAKLRTTTLEISLRAEKAELANRRAVLEELRNGSRPEEIEQAAGELAAAAAVLTSTKSRYERARSLHERQAINDEQLQDAVAAFQRAEATHAAAAARHKLLKNGARPEQIAGGEARVAFQAEQVRLIEEQIERHTVVAPFDGYVAQEHTQIGQWLGRGDPIAEVIELADVEVEVFVLEQFLGSLRTGASVQVSVPAVPSEFFTGRIESIVPQADLRSRSFPVRIRIRNTISPSGPLLKAGMLARAQMPLGDPRPALLIDKDAIVFGGTDPVVYVLDRKVGVNGETSARGVPVQLGVMDDELIEVKGPIKPGDLVVIRGNERLTNGQSVRVSEVRTQKRAFSEKKKPAKQARNGIGS